MNTPLGELFATKIGDTLFIFDAESRPGITKKIKRALAKGETIIHEDKSREWIETIPIHDPTKTGSDEYVWDKSGDRIKCNRIRHTSKDGNRETETLSPVFKGWDAVFNE